MKKALLLLTLMIFYFCPVFCQTLYTSTVQAGYRANPGLSGLGNPRIFFDDVRIPSSQVQGTDSVRITKLKFGVSRGASAPAVTVSFYYTVADDTATMYNTLIHIPPVLIGSVDLPANGPTAGGVILNVGDSVNELFAVKTDTGFVYTGSQTFFLGLGFSSGDGLNGWALSVPGAPQSENDDALWIYNADSSVKRAATYFGGPPNPSATFYMQVFGGGFNTVPVTLVEFTARRSGKVNLLNWSTQQELNTRYFVVERSNDARNYRSIGQVTAAGNSNIIRRYAFTDNNPIKGVNYYRLRTIDKDNSARLSATRSIRNAGIADVSIYPNPVADILRLSINADKATDGQLSITDVNGRIVYSRSVKLPQGNSLLPVPVNNIAAGSYIMKIQLDDDVIVKKFSKQ